MTLTAPAVAWTWPADGQVIRAFSLGDDPYAGGQHRGVDISGEPGSGVRAPAPGTVSFAGTVPGSGRTITIRTEDGYAVTLVGLGSIGVVKNAALSEGETVGTVAAAPGDGTPASVHLGVRVASDPNGYIDPLSLLPVRSEQPNAVDQVVAGAAGDEASPEPVAGVESSDAGIEPSSAGAEPSSAGAEPSSAGAEPSSAGAEPSSAGAEP
ncbi:MAG TPA: peptidoglycan DD-metalloendopeptidase family protein, partial [Gaiellaceae bacterium]